jgi:hypothetical protein
MLINNTRLPHTGFATMRGLDSQRNGLNIKDVLWLYQPAYCTGTEYKLRQMLRNNQDAFQMPIEKINHFRCVGGYICL